MNLNEYFLDIAQNYLFTFKHNNADLHCTFVIQEKIWKSIYKFLKKNLNNFKKLDFCIDKKKNCYIQLYK